ASATVGALLAEMVVLRQMSLSIAGQLEAGQSPNVEAACVKDLGTLLEQRLPEVAHELFEELPSVQGGSDYARVLAYITQVTPSFSLRGVTREILRGIIATGVGLGSCTKCRACWRIRPRGFSRNKSHPRCWPGPRPATRSKTSGRWCSNKASTLPWHPKRRVVRGWTGALCTPWCCLAASFHCRCPWRKPFWPPGCWARPGCPFHRAG